MAVIKGVRLAELRARVDAANYSAVTTAGLIYADLVRRMMRDLPKSGAPGPVRQRSAPGEAPAVQYGTLVSAIAVDTQKVGGQGWVATVGVTANAPYALALEFGTARIAPRPAWRPAFPLALSLANAALARKFATEPSVTFGATAVRGAQIAAAAAQAIAA